MNATKLKPTENEANGLPITADAAWLEVLRKQVNSLRFGVVQIVVHEGRVVQIERTEKVRFQAPASSSSTAHHPLGWPPPNPKSISQSHQAGE